MFENNQDYREIFKALLKLASPVDTFTKKRGYTFQVKRGSLLSSINEISKISQTSHQKVRTALSKFAEEEALEIEAYSGTATSITIVNYAKYQDKGVLHDNKMYYNKHKKIVTESTQKTLLKSNKNNNVITSFQHADNTPITRSIYIEDTKDTKDIKESVSYKPSENELTSFKKVGENKNEISNAKAKQTLHKDEISTTIDKKGVNSNDRERFKVEVQNMIFKGFKELKNKGINAVFNENNFYMKESSKLKFNEFLNVVGLDLDEFDKSTIFDAVEKVVATFYKKAKMLKEKNKEADQQIWLSYFVGFLLESYQEKKAEEIKKVKVKKINSTLATLEIKNDLKPLNEEFHKTLVKDLIPSSYIQYFKDKVYIKDIDDNKNPCVAFCSKDAYNYIYLSTNSKLIRALEVICQKTITSYDVFINEKECGGFSINYK